jgi:hypothetical protein
MDRCPCTSITNLYCNLQLDHVKGLCALLHCFFFFFLLLILLVTKMGCVVHELIGGIFIEVSLVAECVCMINHCNE